MWNTTASTPPKPPDPPPPPSATAITTRYQQSGKATCQGQQCTLALVRPGLDPAIERVCLHAPASAEGLAGGQPTCTLVGHGSSACTRSDKYATLALTPPITWSQCP